MVIGFDGSRAFSSQATGTENYSYQLLKALSLIDTENNYLIYLRPGAKVRGEWPQNFKFKTLNYPRFWTQIGLALETFTSPIDVLFVPSHTLPILKKPGLKTVMTVHDLGAEFLPTMHQLKQRLYLQFMTHHQLKTATKLIAVSEATKEDIVKRVGVDPKKIEVIYEGWNEELFKQVKGDVLVDSLREFGLSKNNYFLFVGTIQPRKNLKRIIEAFALYCDTGPASSQPHPTKKAPRTESPVLALVGGKGWLADEIYELPEKLGIADRVKFLGRVKDEKLPALFSGAKALIFPSLFEGFGLPILEAQACGCPVITSNISSMPEVAGKGGLLVSPEDVKEISQAMVKIEDKKVRSQLIESGYNNLRNFSWQKAAKQTLKLFKEINNG